MRKTRSISDVEKGFSLFVEECLSSRAEADTLALIARL